MHDIFLNTFVLADGQFYELKKVIEEIQINDLISFIADDRNEYDIYAVKVFWNEYMLGYLEQNFNQIIFNMLISNLRLYGLVTRINKRSTSKLEFDIYLQLCTQKIS